MAHSAQSLPTCSAHSAQYHWQLQNCARPVVNGQPDIPSCATPSQRTPLPSGMRRAGGGWAEEARMATGNGWVGASFVEAVGGSAVGALDISKANRRRMRGANGCMWVCPPAGCRIIFIKIEFFGCERANERTTPYSESGKNPKPQTNLKSGRLPGCRASASIWVSRCRFYWQRVFLRTTPP
jgi:hypothetical protein